VKATCRQRQAHRGRHIDADGHKHTGGSHTQTIDQRQPHKLTHTHTHTHTHTYTHAYTQTNTNTNTHTHTHKHKHTHTHAHAHAHGHGHAHAHAHAHAHTERYTGGKEVAKKLPVLLSRERDLADALTGDHEHVHGGGGSNI
jgi:hypothetical protein